MIFCKMVEVSWAYQKRQAVGLLGDCLGARLVYVMHNKLILKVN